MMPYLLVIISSLLWVCATQYYSYIGKQIPIFLFSFLKTCVAFPLFLIGALLTTGLTVKSQAIPYLLISGTIGYTLADLLIFLGFARLGPARTLMINSFGPSMIALFSFLVFGRELSLYKLLGLFMVIVCLYFLALEKKKKQEVFCKDHLKLLALVFFGMSLEALGTSFSKEAFLIDPHLNSTTANVYRLIPAFFILPLFAKYNKTSLNPLKLPRDLLKKILFASTIGTWFALLLYVEAISMPGHPAVLAALSSLSPIYATTYEHFKLKTLPNRHFIFAILSMIPAVLLMIFAS